MPNLYLIEYGCSICSEHLVVSADDEECANDFAYQEAQSVYYSYECNEINPEDYPDAIEEELVEIEEEEMEMDIHYFVEPFDDKNDEHIEILKEQNNRPFEI